MTPDDLRHLYGCLCAADARATAHQDADEHDLVHGLDADTREGMAAWLLAEAAKVEGRP